MLKAAERSSKMADIPAYISLIWIWGQEGEHVALYQRPLPPQPCLWRGR